MIENGNAVNGINCQEYDVILGSDIVYERTLILPLCKILKSYINYGTNKGFKTIAYIACTERSYTTLECFEVIFYNLFHFMEVVASKVFFFAYTSSIFILFLL